MRDCVAGKAGGLHSRRVAVHGRDALWGGVEASGNLDDLTTKAKANLVTAINEAARTGSGGGADIDLGITGASAGQAAKVKAVDSDGKPTAWEPVDMPSGGGDWELFAEQTVEEEVWRIEVPVEKTYKNILIIDDMPQASMSGHLDIQFNGIRVFIGDNSLTNSALVYTRKRAYLFHCAEPYVLTIASASSQNQIGSSIPAFSYYPYNGGAVTSIRYGGIVNNRLLPVGTSVKFYGR